MHAHMQNMQYTCTADEISTAARAVFEKLNFNVNKFYTLVLVFTETLAPAGSSADYSDVIPDLHFLVQSRN